MSEADAAKTVLLCIVRGLLPVIKKDVIVGDYSNSCASSSTTKVLNNRSSSSASTSTLQVPPSSNGDNKFARISLNSRTTLIPYKNPHSRSRDVSANFGHGNNLNENRSRNAS